MQLALPDSRHSGFAIYGWCDTATEGRLFRAAQFSSRLEMTRTVSSRSGLSGTFCAAMVERSESHFYGGRSSRQMFL